MRADGREVMHIVPNGDTHRCEGHITREFSEGKHVTVIWREEEACKFLGDESCTVNFA